MIDKNVFTGLRENIARADALREESILASRKILSLSKQIINGLHRGDDVSALLVEIRSAVHALPESSASLASVARQEYVEALTFHSFLVAGSLASPEELNVSSEEYLLGLCDLSGELVRYAVQKAIDKDVGRVELVRSFLSDLYAELLQFTFRNSELRKKSDSVRWNLQKVEDLLLRLSAAS